jgi:hypothetical protein
VSRLDEPLVTWWECVLGDYDSPEGVVVALPHSADRLDVGLAIYRTHWGSECGPGPGDVTIRAAWARLLTLREQWQWGERESGRDATDATDDPPEDWWPDESTPAWVEIGVANGEQVWIVEWTT